MKRDEPRLGNCTTGRASFLALTLCVWAMASASAVSAQSLGSEPSTGFMEPDSVPPDVQKRVDAGEAVSILRDGFVDGQVEYARTIQTDEDDDESFAVCFAGVCILRYLACDPPHNVVFTRLLPGDVHYYRAWNGRACGKLKCYKCPAWPRPQINKYTAPEVLADLELMAEKLFAQYLDILAARTKARDALKADLGCECDANYCHTEKNSEPISAGETDSYCHDDQDRGQVTVRCNSGEIDVIISTAIWDTFKEYDRKTLRPGQIWHRGISEQSCWYDQTNRVEIVGKADSNYNLDFKSWDD